MVFWNDVGDRQAMFCILRHGFQYNLKSIIRKNISMFLCYFPRVRGWSLCLATYLECVLIYIVIVKGFKLLPLKLHGTRTVFKKNVIAISSIHRRNIKVYFTVMLYHVKAHMITRLRSFRPTHEDIGVGQLLFCNLLIVVQIHSQTTFL